MERNGDVDGRAVGSPLDSQMKRDSVTNSPYLSCLGERDLDFQPSPRPGLQHYNSTPIKSNDSCKDQEVAFSRSKTDKREAMKCDLLLDRLSEREKKKIMGDLVKIQNNGTVEVNVAQSAPVATELLKLDAIDFSYFELKDGIYGFNKPIPKLKIAMLVVGTRGDIQPFIAFAKRLQEFGHHVRLATHVNFRNFVRSAGIEFYPLGGDPRIMAGYMARNKGFLLSGPAEISIQRKQLKEIINSLLPACTEPDLETGVPFRAQAIIANPPAYGHAHVAEALGIPLHIFFTMPWTPTSEFPHPLARVPQSAAYRLSYLVVDLIVWWGIRGYINDFRKRKLKLPSIAYFSTYHGSISHLPTGYLWSPHLVPKPNGENEGFHFSSTDSFLPVLKSLKKIHLFFYFKLNILLFLSAYESIRFSDWGPLVDVVGFCFLNLGTKYQPSKEFELWLLQGSKPLYFGFGSMPIEDTKKITCIILEALRETGQRGIIVRGWGDLGSISEVSSDIFFIDDCPHDWLFPQCTAVVHHGGAGTTAAGLRAGCPTTVVPFFGDQFFWGERILSRGIGPPPIPIAELNVERLSNAIRYMLQPEVKLRAMELGKEIDNEDGVEGAVDAFHRHYSPTKVSIKSPTPSRSEEVLPHPFQWLLTVIEKWCCLPFTIL